MSLQNHHLDLPLTAETYVEWGIKKCPECGRAAQCRKGDAVARDRKGVAVVKHFDEFVCNHCGYEMKRNSEPMIAMHL